MNDFNLGWLARDRDEEYVREADRDRPAALLRASRLADEGPIDAGADRTPRTATPTLRRVHLGRHLPHVHRPAFAHRP